MFGLLPSCSLWRLGVCLAVGLLCSAVCAQPVGFQLNRLEPAQAGSWGFAVDHPWYSRTRYFAVGLTGNYGYAPLVSRQLAADGTVFAKSALIEHQVLGHLDVAASFLDRISLILSWPVTVFEHGEARFAVTPTYPAFGDPRLGVLGRVWGQPDASPFSIGLGGTVWVPLRSFVQSDLVPPQASDSSVRGMPQLVFSGFASRVRYSVTAGVLLRPASSLGEATLPDGATVGHEARIGVLLQYADKQRGFAVGPEALFATSLSPNLDRAQNYNSLEVLLGAQYRIANVLQIGLAGGVGFWGMPGTPMARGLLRIAYAPTRVEKPKPQVDPEPPLAPRCPPGLSAGAKPGECLAPDQDGDGVHDAQDKCPSQPAGLHPDEQRPGCPMNDTDQDGVFDAEDQCRETPMGPTPDPAKLGCPLIDRDRDGVDDAQDQCPEVAQGPHPAPSRKGCPDADKDGDGVFDGFDMCVDTPQGLAPDPKRPGCPALDFDGDTVPDDVDACPERPGVPSSDRRKNGCPGLVALSGGSIRVSQQVFFKFGKDRIQKASYPLLIAVADLLKARPELRRIEIQGHTDNRGPADYNLDLSERRAQSVLRFLVEQGIESARVTAKGYGDTQPLKKNNSKAGRLTNRRVVFIVVDPPLPPAFTPLKLPKRTRKAPRPKL